MRPADRGGRRRHRLVVLVAVAGSRRRSTPRSPRRSARRRASTRSWPRSRASRTAEATLQERVTPHRELRAGPERAGAAARPRQPQPARHAVADRAPAGRRVVTIEGRSTTLIALSDFVGNLGDATPCCRSRSRFVDSRRRAGPARRRTAAVAPELIRSRFARR